MNVASEQQKHWNMRVKMKPTVVGTLEMVPKA